MTVRLAFIAVLGLMVVLAFGSDQHVISAGDIPLKQKPDGRYKADILVIVAHPDETAIFSYLESRS